jgi:transcriptional regulator with XRE-family HTH domain
MKVALFLKVLALKGPLDAASPPLFLRMKLPTKLDSPDYRRILQQCMAAAGFLSLRSLSVASGVSRRQISRLQAGEAHLLSVHHALQLARSLQLPLPELLQRLSPVVLDERRPPNLEPSAAIAAEYERLKAELASARSQHLQSFQAETLNTLETLLLQWPTAAYAAQQNPTAPAIRLLPLLQPLEKLLQAWQIEPIGAVGQTVPYEPQMHQWTGVTEPPEPSASVRISHVGYRQAGRLLYRAKVRLVEHS